MMVDFHLCVYTACLSVSQSQLRIGAGPRKTSCASLANYWKEGQGRFQFVANISQRRAEAARKGVAAFDDRESRGYSDFCTLDFEFFKSTWNTCVHCIVCKTFYFMTPILQEFATLKRERAIWSFRINSNVYFTI